MAAPKGNQFWKLASRHGCEKLFATPELLKEAAEEYFEWCEEHPLHQQDFIGTKEGVVEVSKERMRPFTLEGLCIYLRVNTVFFHNFEQRLKERQLPGWQEFSKVCTYIRDTIRNQKFTGAASGFFNAQIIARDLGLANKQELTGEGGKALNPTVIVQLPKDVDRFNQT